MQDSVVPESPAWIEVAVEVAGIDAELAADLLRQACPGGAAIEAPSRLDRDIDAYVLDGDAPAVVKGYIPSGDDAARLLDSVRLALNVAPLQREPRWREPAELEEREWRDSWKKYFGVQRFGENTIVAPTWIEYVARSAETVIRIDPGMAFGTGQHPTTALCLAALEKAVTPGMAVLDLGCGSGILAIAAAKFGATRVLALDNDSQAVKAAADNVLANEATNVEVREGSLGSDTESAAFDIVVANISSITLGRLAGGIASVLLPGGRLIASGFLEDAVDELCTTFNGVGLQVDRTIEMGVWRSIMATRPVQDQP